MNTFPELKEEELRAFFQENLRNVVGRVGWAHKCPITRFYKEKYNLDIATTRSYIRHYPPYGNSQKRPVEAWTKRFTRLIDHLKKQNVELVTGEEALKILDEALLEPKEGERA